MIFDITRAVTPALAVWPGDTPYSHTWVMRRDQGDSVNVSTLTLSAHTGTHADAPLHFDDGGPTIAQMALDLYLGAATVVELDLCEAIHPHHLAHVDLARVERLLIKTPAGLRDDGVWEDDFAWPTVETVALLARHGVRLFGTDAPSVDHVHSKTLESHHALHRAGIAILENLALRDVLPGDYELIALPLNLPVDGSPLRAILRTLASP